MNIIQIFEKFPTQESCIDYLENARWGKKAKCVYCGTVGNTYPIKSELRHHCNACRKSFSVTVGTIFHHTHVPLQKQFLLISLMMNAKKGLSACQAARDIEVRRPIVWSMMHRIRKAMTDDGALLSGIAAHDCKRKSNESDDKTAKKRDKHDNSAIQVYENVHS